MKANVILFHDFETLDVFGPVEVIGKLEKAYELGYYSEHGGLIKSSQNEKIDTLPMAEIKEAGLILIPGGFGTRKEANNEPLIKSLKELCLQAQFVLTVCTGSGLLARTGLLKGRKATSNKMAFDWAMEQDKEANWIRQARWVRDGNYYTSSGVSAGIDMALGFVADQHGQDIAERIAKGIEYLWNKDRDKDPFAI